MGAVNNPGTNTVHEGVKATGANSVVFGLDMYSASSPSGNFYVTEDGASFYVTEDGLNNYVTES